MNNIQIQIAGVSGAGKTAVMKLLAKTLKEAGFQVNVNYGHDDASSRSSEIQSLALSESAKKSLIILTELNLRKY